jgi:hypothetical protein
MQHYTNIVKLRSQFQKGNFMHSCCPAVTCVWARYNHTCYSCYHSSCDHTTTCTVVTATTDALTQLTLYLYATTLCYLHTTYQGSRIHSLPIHFIWPSHQSYFSYRTWPGPVLLGVFNLNGNIILNLFIG